MTTAVVPVAKAVYLCDFHVGYQDGKTDLYGLFNAIRPTAFPHVHRSFVVFAQLINGLGNVSFFVDVRHAGRDELIHTTSVKQLFFPDRTTLVQMALAIEGCGFPEPGVLHRGIVLQQYLGRRYRRAAPGSLREVIS